MATPMLLRSASSRTPKALIRVVSTRATIEMNVNIVVRPVGSGESRNAVSPTTGLPSSPSTAKATMTATADTVKTWAQKYNQPVNQPNVRFESRFDHW